MMRHAIDVIVSYSGDAQDHITVSLKFDDPDTGGTSTVRLVNHYKTTTALQDGAYVLQEIVETGVVYAPIVGESEQPVRSLWGAVMVGVMVGREDSS